MTDIADEVEVELQIPLNATLTDLLNLVLELRDIHPMGRRGRQILFTLAAAAHDVPGMNGIVVDGEVVETTGCHCLKETSSTVCAVES